MKTIFDKNIREKLIERIDKISGDNIAEWGKMNVNQMLKHSTYWNKWVLGKGNHTYKQAFLGKIFGKIALKKMIRDEKPFDKNIPTSDQFKVKETGDIESEKSDWVSLIKDYEFFNNPGFIHDFFGKMTKEQIGILVYKHTDHHLRQFGV
ncbi:DUF1569 domain-containing protein [Tamlana sp. 2_MG-2023]|uniref:DUF1569 domain-containing protein n=1 Tax=unclassified Tamlana TaxID=2614803 RepID=UPI0026E283C9|nr:MULTISPECIES: DUF1569 domain-containing protein [unclassified Tamlana]MDO6761855.1 DUF1569 domain-containing protein [Tamlana sp. 2_MG-2023]MDO6792626.1 DUF1569 domain-containing protein [Tamlana sp. 1_MG-2023]